MQSIGRKTKNSNSPKYHLLFLEAQNAFVLVCGKLQRIVLRLNLSVGDFFGFDLAGPLVELAKYKVQIVLKEAVNTQYSSNHIIA
jgi:hypothetical protein